MGAGIGGSTLTDGEQKHHESRELGLDSPPNSARCLLELVAGGCSPTVDYRKENKTDTHLRWWTMTMLFPWAMAPRSGTEHGTVGNHG